MNMQDFGLKFSALRDKWREVPQGSGKRIFSEDLLSLDHAALIETWQRYNLAYRQAAIRYWYQTLYKEFMRDKTVLEIGSGFGLDGVFFMQEGAKHWTFCDIINANLEVIRHVCGEYGLSADFAFIDDDFECFDKLGVYDVVWANGSLINVPFEFARAECMKVLPHLKPGGRWIELCYPRERWIREGQLPFSEWGKSTDGERTPWVEWYDLVKIKRRLFPAAFETILDFSFNNGSLNWFDLILSSAEPFDPNVSIVDIEIFPGNPAPVAHGDSAITAAGEAVEIVTPEMIWSYAAAFDLTTSFAASKTSIRPDNGFTIEIELRVHRGHAGILLIGADDSTPTGPEYMVPAHPVPSILTINVPPQAGTRQLIFRNVAASGRSHLELKRITARFVSHRSTDLLSR